MIKVGIIGFGYAAKTFHLPLLEARPEFHLVALSSSQTKLQFKQHPDVKIFPHAELLLTSKLIDLVIITSPNNSHFSLAKMALEQGLHVVVEKPMAVHSEEAYQLCELAQKMQRVITVFHNRRWDGDFLTVKKLINAQVLGKLKVFESHFDRFRPLVRDRWRENPGQGSGIWYDLGAHLVDQALLLFGWPLAVTGRLSALRDDSKNVDYFHVQLHYHDLEVILQSSPFNAGPNPRFQLSGNLGSFVKFGLDPQEDQLKTGLALDHQDFGVDIEAHQGTLFTGTSSQRIACEQGCYSSFYQQLASAILEQTPLPVQPQSAAQVIALIEAVEQSHKRGLTLKLPVHSSQPS